MSWWAIAATGCRGQYGHGAPVPVGAVGAAARIVAYDPSEEGVCRFNQGGLRFGHRQCGPRASRTAALWRWAAASGMPAFAGEGCGRVEEGDSGARWQGAEGQGHDAARKAWCRRFRCRWKRSDSCMPGIWQTGMGRCGCLMHCQSNIRARPGHWVGSTCFRRRGFRVIPGVRSEIQHCAG